MGDTPAFLSTTQLCQRWELDRKTVLAGIRNGEVPCTRVGRRWLIPTAWVERQESADAPVPAASGE
jgi:excisionase family DNA binding protein